MLVKDLIKLLQKENPNALVCVSSDEEGNAFSRLADGFGKGDFKTEPEFMKTCFYGLDKADFEKEYIVLYPEI